MGVYGLWRLLDATGKQVPLETLEGKVLAIDVSIWIHQVLQGYQDRFGNTKPNAHLIGLFNRICKLLYYKIKPVFVFDGGVPMLKKDTIALRRKQKSMAKNKAQQMRTELISNLIKHSAVKTILNTEKQSVTNKSTPATLNVQSKQTVDDMFKLPDVPATSKESDTADEYDSDSSVELSPRKQTKWMGNIHSVDVSSAEFRALPADVRYDILTDLKETRKQNSWGRLHEMPEEYNEFSGFQMKRLLKRRLVQESLESAEQEMGGKTLTLEELEKLLIEQGIPTNVRNCAYRVATDSTTRLIYISDKNAHMKNSNEDTNSSSENTTNNVREIDEPVAGSSKTVPIFEDMNEYEFNDAWDSDIEASTSDKSKMLVDVSSETESELELNESRPLSKKYFGKNVMNPALTYMLEYSGLTEKQIVTLLEQNRKDGNKNTGNSLKAIQESDSIEARNFESTTKVLSEERLKSTAENDEELAMVDFVEESNTNTALSVELSSAKVSHTSNDEDAKSIKSSDSDSDDFIEIEDVPVPIINTNIMKKAPPKSFQVTFKSDEKIEDDLFADIFDPINKLNGEGKTQNTLKLNESSEKSMESIHKNQETSEEKVVPKENIEKSTRNEFQNNELPDVIQTNDIAVESIENDTSTQKKNTQLEDNENNDAESINTQSTTNTNISVDDLKNTTPLPTNEEELMSLRARLEDEQTDLMANIGKLERQATDITDQIRIEAQELLRLFGIPYVVAPMEAEAQCAYLEQIRLTDGTITDDSDIWLFGGQCVYKNFFDNNKKVLQFQSCDIQHHFKLTRNELIRLALLVGSDYTIGLTGIGPVTALEILAAFPSYGDDLLQGLVKFCSWINGGRSAAPGRAGLRNKLQNLQVQKGFPSQAVIQAYLFPKVDESKEGFTWGKPNTILLSNYAKEKFGWNTTKFDEIITPVLKRLEEKQNQKTIDKYFKIQTVPKSIEMTLSKRVQKAVQRLNNPNAEGAEDSSESREIQVTKRKKAKLSKENERKKREAKLDEETVDVTKPKILNVSTTNNDKIVEEYIPQREKDKAESLKKKLHAIEVFRKSKKGLNKTRKVQRCIRKVKEEADLSESDSSS